MQVLRGCLRLLFSPNEQVRGEILPKLAWILSSEEQQLPSLLSLDMPNAADIFLVHTPAPLMVSESYHLQVGCYALQQT